jgi:hypothetical protein
MFLAMDLRCTDCDTPYYSASTTTSTGTPCSVPKCDGTLAAADGRRLVTVRPS